jgi:galactose mutarotase-like enzyme
MATIRTYRDGPYEMIELVDEKSGSAIQVCPERGAIITSFVCRGEELFYLDRETFMDPGTNIRGGNPILFPISGQLKDGSYMLDGKQYRMANHGLARSSPWEVEEAGSDPEGQPFVRLRLTGTKAHLESYPFPYQLEFTYTVNVRGELVIRQEYRNLSERDMPVYAGFHPYFAAPGKTLEPDTDATRYLDYNDGQMKPFTGVVELASLKEAVVLMDAREPRISFRIPLTDRRVVMEYSEVFRYVVFWSVEGKDFVCVEPWMAANGELNRGDELVWIKPGDTLRAELAIYAGRE